MNILLGLTGSVASTLAPKIVKKLQELGEVKVIYTEKSLSFFDIEDVRHLCKGKVYGEDHEWDFPCKRSKGEFDYPDLYKKDDPVLHIDIRDWADVLVIAPLTANTMAKMANGICDNLLSTVYRAWRPYKPVIIAPAMNTQMWENWITKQQLNTLQNMGKIDVVMPVNKVLACGEEGMGAMAHIDTIYDTVKKSVDLVFPLKFEDCNGIPIYPHLGSYGIERKFGKKHGGVDLYSKKGAYVHAMEDGVVLSVERFTGPNDNSPWWNDTWAIFVKGATGVICYGEVDIMFVKKNDRVRAGNVIGRVGQVLKDDALRPDIRGHSLCMLHVEIYKHKEGAWNENKERIDPTPMLLSCRDNIPMLEK